MEIYSETAVNF